MLKRSWKKFSAAALATSLALASSVGLSSCGNGGRSAYKPEKLSDKTVNLAKNLKADENMSMGAAADFTEKNLGFAAEFFKKSYEGKNMLISPLSMSIALAMTTNGARGETLAEMENTLGLPREELNCSLAAYMNELAALSGENLTLSLADSIWIKDDRADSVKESFLQKNKDFYNAEIFASPFDESTLEDVNKWTRNKTEGMIKRLLSTIESGSVLYLINALYFAGEWQLPYEEEQVREGEFTNADGASSSVKMMYSTEASFLWDENSVGFLKPYKGGKVAFAAFLPSEDTTIGEYVAGMSATKWKNLMESEEKDKEVSCVLPAFSYDFSVAAKDLLIGLGMERAFSDAADFGDMWSGGRGICIDEVLQKTRIEVTERGTKAAAATLIGMKETAVPVLCSVTLDRPFVYAIVDMENKYPLFLGAVTDLSEPA